MGRGARAGRAVRGRARRRRRGAREGDGQRRAPARLDRRGGARAARARRGGTLAARVPRPRRRRRRGAAGAGMVGAVIRPGDAEAYHFCGHIYTTDGCPHPTGLPRIDRRGLPLRARDGRQVDDLGRLIDALGRPVDEDGCAARRSRGPAAAGRAAHAGLHAHRRTLPDPRRDRRRLVPLLRRARAQARRLLLAEPDADQRRPRAARLLLRQAQGVLRHVLPEQRAVLTRGGQLRAGGAEAWETSMCRIHSSALRRCAARSARTRFRKGDSLCLGIGASLIVVFFCGRSRGDSIPGGARADRAACSSPRSPPG